MKLSKTQQAVIDAMAARASLVNFRGIETAWLFVGGKMLWVGESTFRALKRLAVVEVAEARGNDDHYTLTELGRSLATKKD